MVQVTIAVLGLAGSLVAGPRWLVCLDLAPVHHLPWALALAAAILSCVDLVTVMTFPLAVQVSIAQWALVSADRSDPVVSCQNIVDISVSVFRVSQ